MPSDDDPVFLTDDELCKLLRISRRTLGRQLKDGPPKRHPDASDVRKIRCRHIGGERRWVRESVLAFIDGKEG